MICHVKQARSEQAACARCMGPGWGRRRIGGGASGACDNRERAASLKAIDSREASSRS
jgi:hypothetical protein